MGFEIFKSYQCYVHQGKATKCDILMILMIFTGHKVSLGPEVNGNVILNFFKDYGVSRIQVQKFR